MRVRRLTILAVTAVLCAAPLAASALAAGGSPSQAITECSSQGRLLHSYTATALRTALATMPADVKEYSDCYDVINRALAVDLGKLHAGDASGGSGGSFLPTPVIVVLAVLVLGAGGLAMLAVRRRGSTT